MARVVALIVTAIGIGCGGRMVESRVGGTRFEQAGPPFETAAAEFGPIPSPPAIGGRDEWTLTELDEVLATRELTCHVRQETETIRGSMPPNRYVRDVWSAPETVLAIARAELNGTEAAAQVHATVEGSDGRLTVTAVVPARVADDLPALRRLLAHPGELEGGTPTSLQRSYVRNRDGERLTIDEHGDSALNERYVVRERDGGQSSELRAFHPRRSDWYERAYMDAAGRHIEQRWEHTEPNARSGCANSNQPRADAPTDDLATDVTDLASCRGHALHYERRLERRDPAGRLRMEQRFNASGAEVGRRHYRYDASGVIVISYLPQGEPDPAIRILRDDQGRPVRLELGDRLWAAGLWSGGRLVHVRHVRDFSKGEETIYERAYDREGRLTHSSVVSHRGEQQVLRSQTRVTYRGCDEVPEVPLEPDHISPFERVP